MTLDHTAADLAGGVMSAAHALLNAALPEDDKIEKIEKVGFARGVLTQLTLFDEGKDVVTREAVDLLEANFQALCKVLGEMRREAMREHSDVKLSDRVARIRDGFLEDHQTPPLRVDVEVLFEEMVHALDNSPEAEDVRSELRRLTDVHELAVDSGTEVADFELLRGDLQALQYRGRQQSQEGQAGSPNETVDEEP